LSNNDQVTAPPRRAFGSNGATRGGPGDGNGAGNLPEDPGLLTEIQELRRWSRYSGPLLTLLAGSVLSIVEQWAHIPNHSLLLLLPVVAATLNGGLVAGLISAVLALGFALYLYPPEHQLLLTSLNAPTIITDAIAITFVVFLTSRLRDNLTRATLTSKVNSQLSHSIEELERRARAQAQRITELEDFVENAAIGLHWVTSDGTIVWANQAELDLLGYTQEEYIGRNIREFHADAETIDDILARLTAGETLNNYEARLRCKNGAIRYVLITSNVWRESGRFVHTRCFTRDITERRLQELAAQAEAEHMRNVVAAISVPLYTTDTDGHITFYNEPAADLWGRHPELLQDLWTGAQRLYHLDGAAMAPEDCPMAVTLKTGRAVQGKELFIERPDGSQALVLPHPQPVRNAAGELTGAVNVLIDITARHQVEDALKQKGSEAKRAIAELQRRNEITRLLAEAHSLSEISQPILRMICELTDCRVASIWTADGNMLRCLDTFSSEPDRFSEFLEVTRTMAFQPGSGLPGRVLSGGNDVWIYDVSSDTNFPRKPYSTRVGLNSACAVPLRTSTGVAGVVEVFFEGRREPDLELQQMLDNLSTKLGVQYERELATRALQESERRFRALFEQAGVGVVQADVDGRIVSVNERYAAMLGYQPAEMKGRALQEFIHPKDVAKFVYRLGLLWAGEAESLAMERREVRRDGSPIWVNATVTVVRRDNGEAEYTVGVVEDISARVEAQEQLSEQRGYLDNVLENVPLLFAVFDKQGHYERVFGKGRELALTGDDRIGKSIASIYGIDSDAMRMFNEALGGGLGQGTLDIGGRRFQTFFTPRYDANGEIVGVIAVANDVSELVEVKAEAYRYQSYLQAILEHAPLNMAIMDLEGRYLHYVDKSFKVPGHESDPRIGRRVEEIYPELTEYHAAVKAARDGKVFSKPIVIGPKTVQLIVLPLTNAQGAVEGVIAVATDISDLVKAQQQARELQDYLSTAINNSPMVLTAVNTEGRYELFIGNALEPLGITANSRLGASIFDAHKDAPETLEAYRRALAGETVNYSEETFGVAVNIFMTPHYDADGNIVGAIALATDITERVRREAELRRGDLRQRTMLENAPLILVEIDKDGTVQLAIGRGLIEAGAEQNQSVGTNVYETNKDKPERIELFERALAGETVEFVLAEGPFAFSGYMAPKRGLDGEVEGVISVLTNISEAYRLQQELQESEAQYRDLVETTQDVIWSLDADGRWTFLNQAAGHVYGYEPEEMLGHYYWEYLPEELRERERLEFAKARPGHSWFQYESRHIRKDGMPVDLLFTSKVVGDADGNVVRITGTATDITERKRAEQQLRERDAVLQVVTDNAPLILAHIGADGVYRQFLGESLSDVGMSAATRLGRSIRDIHPRGSTIREVFEQALEGRQVEATADLPSAGRMFHVIGMPNRDASDAVSDIVMLGVDITPRVTAERALQASEERYRIVSKATNDAIWDWDIVNDHINWNPGVETLFGYSPEEVAGSSADWLSRCVHPDDLESVKTNLQAALASGDTTWRGEYRFVRKDGSFAHVFDRGYVIYEAGQPVRMIGAVQDVTERAQTEAALRAAQQRLDVALTSGSIGTWSWNVTEDYVTGDSELNLLFGFEPKAVDERPPLARYTERIHPDDIAQVQASIQQALTSGRNYEAEYRIVTAERTRWVLARGGVEYDASGAPQTISGAIIDITERKQMEQDLRERELQLRTILESAPMLLTVMDTDGRRELVLGKGLEEVGFERQPGASVFEDYAGMPDVLDPIHQALAGYDSVTTMEFLGRTFHTFTSPRYDGNGNITGVISAGLDITERVRTERALRDSEAFLSTVLDNAPLILTLTDIEGIVRLSLGSAETFGGGRPGQLVGKSIHSLYRDQPDALRIFERALQGEAYNTELTLGDQTYQVTAGPHRDAEGNIIGVISVAADITRAKDTERALREREGELRALVDNMPMVVSVSDAAGIRTMAAGRLLSELGLTEEQVVGQSIFDPEQNLPQVIEAARRAMNGDTVTFTSSRFDRHFYVFFAPRRDSDGNLIGTVSAALDISDRVAIEEELRTAQVQLKLGLASGSISTWFWDAVNDRIHGDAALGQLYDIDPELAESAPPVQVYLDAMHDEDRPHVTAAFTRSGQTGEPYETQYRIKTRDGSTRWILARGMPMYDEQGTLVRFPGVSVDITEQKRTENALRESEQRFRTMSDAAPVMIWVCDAEGNATWYNRPWLEFTGRDLESEIAEGWPNDIHPDDRPQAVHTCLTSCGRREQFKMVFRMRRADGEYRHILDHGIPLFGPDGEFNGYIGSCIDITERVLNEQALEAAKRELEEWHVKLDTLLGSAPVGVALVDTECRYLFVNEHLAHLNGVPAADHVGRTLHQVIPEAVADYMSGLLRQVLERGEPLLNIEANGESPLYPGEVRHFQGSMYPLVTSDGRRLGVGVIILDVTEGRRAALELEATAAALEESHTTINTLLGSVEVGVGIIDADYRYQFVNRWLAQFNGRPAADHIGKSVRQMYPAAADAVEALVQQVITTREPVLNVEVKAPSPWDSDNLRDVLGHIYPLITEDGRIIGAGVFVMDQTERKLAAQALADTSRRMEESLSQLNALLESAPLGVAFYDEDLRYVLINERLAQYDGQRPEDIIGRHVSDVLPELGPELEKIYRRVLETGEPIIEMEISGATPANPGEARHWQQSVFPVQTASGERLGLGVVVLDVTERESASNGTGKNEKPKKVKSGP
jgi:PAS domain S-box-containing protein